MHFFCRTQVLVAVIVLCTALYANAQWTPTNGPFGGKIVDIIVNASGEVFAGTDRGGVYLSSNVGESWNPSNNGITNKSITALGSDGTNIFAGTYDNVFISSDNGMRWIEVSNGLPDATVRAFTRNGQNIFLGKDLYGVFLSTDKGLNWTAVNNGLIDTWITALASRKSKVFAGTISGGVFLTTNNGANWTEINDGINRPNITAIAVSDTNIFVGTLNDGVFLSTNDGMSWIPVNSGITDLSIETIVISGSNIFASTFNDGIFLSTDNGQNWMAVNNGLLDLSIKALAVNGPFIFTGGDGMFISNNNGANWTTINNGLTNVWVTDLAVNGANIFAGTDNGLFLSTDIGFTWTKLTNGLTSKRVLALAIKGSNIFAGTEDGVFLSIDNGANWNPRNNGLPYEFKHSTALAVSGRNIFTVMGGVPGPTNIFLSTDNGVTWKNVTGGLNVSIIEVLVANGPTIFAGTTEGVFLTTDNGANWLEVNNGLTNLYIRALTIVGSNIFTGTDDGVFLSQDNGANWFLVNNGLTNTNIRSLTSDGSNIYAGTDNGVFLTVDNGANWLEISSGLSRYVDVNTFLINDLHIFAGTKGNGIFMRPLDDFEVLGPPTNLMAKAVSETRIDLSWAASATGKPEYYRIFRSSNANFALTDSVNGSITTYSDTALIPATKYIYFVDAVNELYTSPSSNLDSTITDLTAPNLSLVDIIPNPALLRNDVTLIVAATDNHSISSVTLDYRKGSDAEYYDAVQMTANADEFSAMIPGTEVTQDGLLYRLIAHDIQGNRDTLAAIVMINVPENQFSTSLLQNNPYQSGFPEGEWRMISIPLILENKKALAVLKDFGDPGEKRWKLFDGPLKDVSSSANFTIGKAFWLKQILGEGAKEIKPGSGTTAGLKSSNIFLSPGWNQIGNPFTFSIDWEKNTDASQNLNIKGPIKWDGLKYVGSGQISGDKTPFTELLPWDGYWVYNGSNSTQILTIDPTGSDTPLLKNSTSPQNRILKSQVKIHFSAKAGTYEDIYNYIGANSSASDLEDQYDLPELPVIGKYISLYFDHRYQDSTLQPYTIEYRQLNDVGQIWKMYIKTNLNEIPTVLSWNIDNLPEKFELAILDITNNKMVDVFQSQYHFDNKYESHPVTFQIYVGKKDFLKRSIKETSGQLPIEFSLEQNYPNPFNPSTKIRYNVAKRSEVSLIIYNLLGQNIRPLVFQEIQDPGQYLLQWDGKDNNGVPVASGVYIYQLQADNFRMSKKMILIR